MHFIVQKEYLIKPLQCVINALKNRSILPILNNILLKVKYDKLFFVGTDLEIEIIAIIAPSHCYEIGSITIPARKFFDICRSLPARSEITLKLKQDRLLIYAYHNRFLLSTISASDFPNFQDVNKNIDLTCNQYMLQGLIESTQFAMAYQDARYYLNGMLFEIKGEELRTVATDGHRLAICSMPIDIDKSISFYSVIVPRRSVLGIMRLLSFSKKQDLVKIQIGNHNIRILLENYIFTSKLIDGNFPDYSLVFPKKSIGILEIQREVLRQACMRISILSNERIRAVKLSLSVNQLKITSSNSMYEEAEEIIDVQYKNKNINIAFNADYLLDILNSIKCQDVRLLLQDEYSSVKIEACSSKSCSYIIMPIKL